MVWGEGIDLNPLPGICSKLNVLEFEPVSLTFPRRYTLHNQHTYTTEDNKTAIPVLRLNVRTSCITPQRFPLPVNGVVLF